MDRGDPVHENIDIFADNLSLYFIGITCMSIISVLIAYWCQESLDVRLARARNAGDGGPRDDECAQCEENSAEEIVDKDDESISNLRIGKYSMLAEKVASSLTDEQLEEERQMEKKQLEAIFQLLQNQEDKFKVSSVEDLEDQLKLYRS